MTDPVQVPCTACLLSGCEARSKLDALFTHAVRPEIDPGARRLVGAYMGSLRTLRHTAAGRAEYPVGPALAALFDLLVSARYIDEPENTNWVYCPGDGTDEGPSLFYTFVRTCPRCSVRLGRTPRTSSHKPESDTIGAHSALAFAAVMVFLLECVSPTTQIFQVAQRGGDVDFLITDDDLVALTELKASPLVTFPLELRLPSPMYTRAVTGDGARRERVPLTAHASTSVATLPRESLSLYLPTTDYRIELGQPSVLGWALPPLTAAMADPVVMKEYLKAWLQVYAVFTRIPGTPSPEGREPRWLRFGAGGSVDDSKNEPGLARTDDLKKGTYQVLKYGAYYAEKCPRRIVRSMLAGNLDPGRQFAPYLEELVRVVWTKDEHRRPADLEGEPAALVRSLDLFNLYDALFAFTRSWIPDDALRRRLSVESFSAAFDDGRLEPTVKRWAS